MRTFNARNKDVNVNFMEILGCTASPYRITGRDKVNVTLLYIDLEDIPNLEDTVSSYDNPRQGRKYNVPSIKQGTLGLLMQALKHRVQCLAKKIMKHYIK